MRLAEDLYRFIRESVDRSGGATLVGGDFNNTRCVGDRWSTPDSGPTLPARRMGPLVPGRLLNEFLGDEARLTDILRKLRPADLSGGSITISSLGGIGGTAFTPIVNAPEVAVLGVSRAEMKPVWMNGEFVPRLMLPLSLSYDHRVIDGADAVRFTTRLKSVLSDIRLLAL